MSNGMSQTNEFIPQPLESIVEIEGSKTFTTSLIVAEIFEKEHKNVLRDIENLDCSAQFNQLNFERSLYSKETGNGTIREYPYIRMTRDGFSFLAMGFTGKKAAAWKEKFLEAFNAMERKLLIQHEQDKILEDENARKARIMVMLRGFASYWAFIDKMPLCTAELKLCKHMGIKQLEEIVFAGTDYEKITYAFNFINNSCNIPTNKESDAKATNEQLMILRNILLACGQWKHTREINFDKVFEEITGIDPEMIKDLSMQDADKMIATAGCLLHQTYQYARDINNFLMDA